MFFRKNFDKLFMGGKVFEKTLPKKHIFFQKKKGKCFFLQKKKVLVYWSKTFFSQKLSVY